MRLARQLLLGVAAAGLCAVAGAKADDRPAKAKPVEYVKACTLYGAGFWYIPGTDFCIKLGALVRLDANYNGDATGAPLGGVQRSLTSGGGGFVGGSTHVDGQFNFRERAVANFDVRTQTEYGTLRSYVEVGQQLWASGGGIGSTVSFIPDTFPFSSGDNVFFADRAYIQFAGFTAGKMRSFFDMVYLGKYSLAESRVSGDTSVNGILGAAYTWQFGGGLSASLALEDGGWTTGGRGRSTVNLAGGGAPTAFATTAFGIGALVPDNKQQFIDPVMNVRLDQSWGFVGMSLAAHDAGGGSYGAAAASPQPTEAGTCQSGLTDCGHPGDRWGGAASLGFVLNNPFGLAEDDSVGAQGVYALGAVGYATSQWGASALYGSNSNVGLSYLVDGVYDNNTSIKLTQTWSWNAFYEHVWNPQWRTSLYAGMLGIDFGDGKNLICGNPASPLGFSTALSSGQSVFVAGSVSNCNPNSSWSQLGSRTMWNPLPDLYLGVDLSWVHLNTAFGGTAQLQPLGFGVRPGGTYAISNEDAFSAFFRVQRNFVY